MKLIQIKFLVIAILILISKVQAQRIQFHKVSYIKKPSNTAEAAGFTLEITSYDRDGWFGLNSRLYKYDGKISENPDVYSYSPVSLFFSSLGNFEGVKSIYSNYPLEENINNREEGKLILTLDDDSIIILLFEDKNIIYPSNFKQYYSKVDPTFKLMDSPLYMSAEATPKVNNPDLEDINDWSLNGKVQYYYRSGELAMEGFLQDGYPTGHWIGYYPKDGRKYAEGDYTSYVNKSGEWLTKSNGKWYTYWFVNGKEAVEYNFKNGQREIINTYKMRHYKYASGNYGKGETILSAVAYQLNDGNFYFDLKQSLFGKDFEPIAGAFIRTGVWEEFNSEGILVARGNYNPLNNYPIGEWENWRKDGSLMAQKKFNEYGQLHGEYVTYHSNGSVSMKTTYKAGDKDGTCTWYYSNGQIEETAVYLHDTMNGILRRWEIIESFTLDGIERKKGTLKNGSGTWINYKGGTNDISSIVEYENGFQVRESKY